ncbi:hypothetical protein [Chitinibacter sp. S2-10]|uniref:DUF7931 domain-containing protein n=1 Tax=Chitinibacter sp. S2-10 TaxID=3373597 RepID=UPI00397767B6
MATSTLPPSNDATSSTFDTLQGYRSAVIAIISQARHTLQLCEKDFAECDLGSRANQQILWDFFSQASPGRLQLLASNTDYLAGHCPRFLQLRDRFAHLIEIRVIPEYVQYGQKGWMLADQSHYLIRHHYDWYRGELAQDAKYAALLQQQFATLWEQSEPASSLQRFDL